MDRSSTPTSAYYRFTRTTSDRHPLSGETLIAAVWQAPLEWCGAVLGPNGFLVTSFAEVSADTALQHLLDQLNDKLPGWIARPTSDISVKQRDTIAQAIIAFERFGNGERESFDLPLDYQLGTEFQQRVWQTLKLIPWGETISYGELASRIGQPNAARAVGSANGANPLAPVVPCHRVIQSGGSLGGYGGGLPLKSRLLAAEGVTLSTPPAHFRRSERVRRPDPVPLQ